MSDKKEEVLIKSGNGQWSLAKTESPEKSDSEELVEYLVKSAFL